MESIDGIDHVRMERRNNERTPRGSPLSRPDNMELVVNLDARQIGRERFKKMEYYDDDSENQLYYQNARQIKHGELNFYMNSPERTVIARGEQRRFDNFSYYDEGSPSYNERMRDRDRDLSSRVQLLEHNRVELIRKLDELKDQLIQPHSAEDKPKGRMYSLEPHDPYGRLQYIHQDNVHKKQYAVNDFKYRNLRYLSERIPSTGRHVVGVRDSYSPIDSAHESRGYVPRHSPHHEDFFGYERDIEYNRLRLHPQVSHEVSCSCAHCYDRSLDIPSKIDRFSQEPYNPKIRHRHHPNIHIPQDYSAGVSNLQSPTLILNEQDYEKDNFQIHRHRKAGVGQRRGRVCHPVSGGAPFITCCTCFELLKLPTKRMSVAKKMQIKCGACFSVIVLELGSEGYSTVVSALVNPISADTNHGSNSSNMMTGHSKYDDGETNSFPTKEKSKPIVSWKHLDPLSSTSTISANELQTVMDKKPNYSNADEQIDPLSASMKTSVDKHINDADKKLNSDESDQDPDPCPATLSVPVIERNINAKLNFDRTEKQPHHHSATASSSIDYNTDKMLNSFNSEKQVNPPSATSIIPLDMCNIDKESNHIESEKQLDPLSSTVNNSLNEHNNDTNEHSNCDKPRTLDPQSPSLSISAVERNTYVGTSFEDESESKQSMPVFDHMTTELNPQNDATLDTETNLPVNTIVDSYRSQDPEETSEEESEETSDEDSVINVGEGPFFSTANNNTGFQEVTNNNQSLEIEESKVFVNGHFIPDSDVKNAEKLAGPIQPGEYWYDYRAGFWGVMGHPCLGIVMPNIEEFNFPLPKDAAGGNTGVFVNGRELHRADLNILVSRGLPFSQYGSYIVDMSGNVVDEYTGREIVGLGKLAPTVEMKRCGFGMRTP